MVDIIGGASITSKRTKRMLTGLRSIAAGGCRVRLEDGKWYVDFEMGMHGAIYGYRPKWWVDALTATADVICANSFASANERIAAEMLAGFYPDIEAVRFMTNGSDACAAAVKLVRAVTGRDKLLVYGYHGTASAYCTPPEANVRPNLRNDDGKGYPPDMRRGTLEAEREAYVSLDWLDFEPFQQDQEHTLGEVAAVVIECPPVDGGRNAATGWLRCVAETAHDHGALFVLDEVVTGFRYAPGGAAEYYGLQGLVDLYCFGKTMGNGYPMSALAGKRDVMQELAKGVHFSGTFFGDPLGMAAAIATLNQLNEVPPWGYMYSLGEKLKKEWNTLSVPKLEGHPTRPVMHVEPSDAQAVIGLRRHMFRRGFVVVDHPWFVTMAHGQNNVYKLVQAAGEWGER